MRNKREHDSAKWHGKPSQGLEVSEGCIRWIVVVATVRWTVWQSPAAGCGRSGTLPWFSRGEGNVCCCYLQINEQKVSTSALSCYSPSCGHGTFLFTLISSQGVRNHSNYFLPAMIHSPALVCDHVLSHGPQQ